MSMQKAEVESRQLLQVLHCVLSIRNIVKHRVHVCRTAAHPGHGARTNNPPNDSVNYLLLAPALNNKLWVCVALIKHPSSNGTWLGSR